MGSIGARPAAELPSLFGSHLSPLLPELPSLFRAHLSPLLPELLATFGREAFEPLPLLAKHPAFFRGELAKSLKSLSNSSKPDPRLAPPELGPDPLASLVSRER